MVSCKGQYLAPDAYVTVNKNWRLPYDRKEVILLEPQRQKAYFQTCAPSEDSNQPAHSRSLIRIFIGRFLDSQWCKVYLSGQWRLWSDCANAQADLSLRWAHMSEGTVSHVAACLISMWPDGIKSKLTVAVQCLIVVMYGLSMRCPPGLRKPCLSKHPGCRRLGRNCQICQYLND